MLTILGKTIADNQYRYHLKKQSALPRAIFPHRSISNTNSDNPKVPPMLSLSLAIIDFNIPDYDEKYWTSTDPG